MTADELIDGYVADVVMLLPRKQRRDVAQELRLLLSEEVDAAAAGRASREEAARELLAGFGRPAEVAARYGSPVTLVDAADTRRFIILAAAGSAVIMFGAILDGLIVPLPQRDLQQEVAQAWPIVFAWLGLLVVGFATVGWIRRRWPDSAAWKPRPLPTDRINRLGRAAALAFYGLGTFILVNPAWLIRTISGDRAAPAAYEALAYDDAFLRLRGPAVLATLLIALVIQAIVLWHGRWRPWVYRADMAFSLVVCVVLTWTVGTGPVFQTVAADQTAKSFTALIVLVSLIDVAVRARRHHVRQAVTSHG